MAANSTSSLVIVGDGFAPAMFDERAIFEGVGNPDEQGQVKVGPIGQFSYASGKYRFSVTPNRIDLAFNGPDLVPLDLIAAAEKVISKLEPARGAVLVSGLGMNCDTVFDQGNIGKSGVEFCRSHLVRPESLDLIGFRDITASSARFHFERNDIRFTVRIEPYFASQGQSLFTAVNGHQEVTETGSLSDKIGAVDEVREYVDGLHQRILRAT